MDSTTHKGEFCFRGSAEIFVSTMLGLFGDDEGFSANQKENGFYITPRPRGGTYYEFIRFQPFELPDRTLVRWYSPEKANLGALAVKIIERLGELGYIQEGTDQTPQAGTEPAPAEVVGAELASAATVPRRKDVADRVKDAHRLLKTNTTASVVFRDLVHIEKGTYRKYCRGVTGENPLV